MNRFFKWVGIILGGMIGALVLLIVAVVIIDRMTREDPNRNVTVFRVEPAPGGGPLEGAAALPSFPLASWDGDIVPKIDWWSATDANICVPVKQGIIKFQFSESLITTTSPGGQFEGTLNGFKFQVNQTCPAS